MGSWGRLSATIRLFTVQRREVRFQVSWVLIWIARVAILIVPVALALGMLTYQADTC